MKTWSRAKKEALIASDRKRLKKLAECKNETTHKNYLEDNLLSFSGLLRDENFIVSPSGEENK